MKRRPTTTEGMRDKGGNHTRKNSFIGKQKNAAPKIDDDIVLPTPMESTTNPTDTSAIMAPNAKTQYGNLFGKKKADPDEGKSRIGDANDDIDIMSAAGGNPFDLFKKNQGKGKLSKAQTVDNIRPTNLFAAKNKATDSKQAPAAQAEQEESKNAAAAPNLNIFKKAGASKDEDAPAPTGPSLNIFKK